MRLRATGLLSVTLATLCLSAGAAAQGIYPGDPPKDAYTLPGGFEPAPGQDPITVLGEDFVALRFAGPTPTAQRLHIRF